MPQANAATSPKFRTVSLLALLLCGAVAAPLHAQEDLDIPDGWVLVDDLVLPSSVVYGDSTFNAVPWPGGVVPYAFDGNVSAANQTIAIDAMAEWAAAAAVTFVPRTTQPNYVNFKSASVNSSFVGMVGGAQTINVASWGFRFVVCHEICHALGFWHEQSRPDRNTFVTINTSNITPSAIGNFTLLPVATSYGPYDFDSVMHYGQNAFSSNGSPTITVLPPNGAWQTLIGQRQHLSLSDAAGVASQYGAPLPPTIATLSPTQTTTGSGSFTLTVAGTRFCRGRNDATGMAGTVVEWNGVSLATTYLSPTQLTATVPASFVAAPGSHAVTVYNASPGGGVSASTTFTVGAGAPSLTSLSPTQIGVNAAAFTLTANGSGFAPTSVIQWDGAPLSTTFLSSSMLTAVVAAPLVSVAGSHAVTVSTPGGGVSAATTFNVNYPAPFLLSVFPNTAPAGSASTVVAATGLLFHPTTVIRWNGTPLTTTYVGPTQLTAVAPAALLASTGSANVSTFTPGPGGGASTNVPFTLTNSVPTIASLSPSSAAQGSAGFTLSVTGTGFHAGSTVRFAGSPLTTSFVDGTHLAATVPTSSLSAQGSFNVTVQNTGPGGGTSAPSPFVVSGPAAVLTGVSPNPVTAGDASFTLTASGLFFNATSQLRWNQIPLTTTYVSPTQIQATVPASFIATAGGAAVTVGSTSGGGTSFPATVQILGPTVLTLSPPITPALTPGAPPLTVTVSGSRFVPSSVVWANGVAVPTTYFGATLTAALPTSIAQLHSDGGVALTVRNGGTASSNAVALVVVGGANAGTVVSEPPTSTLAPGSVYDIVVRGGLPGAPFTLLVDLAAFASIVDFPTPAVDFVLGVGSPAVLPLIDGLGIFGVPAPVQFGAPPPGAPAGGVFTSVGWTAPASPIGIDLALQCVYADPTSPVGWRLSWAAEPRPY